MGYAMAKNMRGIKDDATPNPDSELRDELQAMEARVRKLRDTRNGYSDQAVQQQISAMRFKASTKSTEKKSTWFLQKSKPFVLK